MYCRFALVALSLGAISCSHSPSAAAPERLAILRFENLSADPSRDWMGRGFQEIISRELAGDSGLYAIPPGRLHSFDAALGRRPERAPGVSSERALAQAAGANRLGYGEYWLDGAKLVARLTMEDVSTGKTQVFSAAGPDIVTAAAALSRRISSRTESYSTANSAAIQAYVSGLEDTDPAASERDLVEAVSADPAFGPPYEALVQLKLRQQDRGGAAAILGRALSRSDRMSEIERAQLAFTSAALKGDAAAQRRALLERTRLTPNDPSLWASVAEVAMNSRDYTLAVQSYQKALQIQPDDPALLNQLGYATAYSGDLGGAVGVLRRYRNLRPADANAFDSLGDVNFLYGRFGEAEEFYLQAAQKESAVAGGTEYRKAAMARLMTGDLRAAAALDKQFLDRRAAARDPLIGYYRAEWSWITGSRKQAYQDLARFAGSAENGPLKQAAAEAYAELAVWSLALDNRTAAEQMAQKANFLAGTASTATIATVEFLAQPSASAADWAARADRAFPSAPEKPVKERALVYALLADRQFAAAQRILKPIYEGGGVDEGVAVMLAWCDLETGSAKEAAALLRFNPLPPRAAVEPFRVFYFPRLFDLRARLAQFAGKTDAAQEQSRLFRQLSGETPLIWDGERQAH